MRRPSSSTGCAFTGQRDALVAVLAQLEDGWARRTTVTGAGAPHERTVRDGGTRLAVHERSHVRQVARAVAAG